METSLLNYVLSAWYVMIWLVDENKTMKKVKNITKHLKEYT